MAALRKEPKTRGFTLTSCRVQIYYSIVDYSPMVLTRTKSRRKRRHTYETPVGCKGGWLQLEVLSIKDVFRAGIVGIKKRKKPHGLMLKCEGEIQCRCK